MTFWRGFLVLTVVHLLAAASPGPDFALAVRESIASGRRAGLLTSLGIALGLAVHITYSAAGIATLVARSLQLLLAVKILGAGFLMYLGLSSLRTPVSDSLNLPHDQTDRGSGLVAKGFLCNLLNPKAPLYFLALFTAVLPADLPKTTLTIYGAWLVLLQWLWFALVAAIFTHERIRSSLMSMRVWIDRVFGVAMIAIALRLLWSVFASAK